LKLVSGTIRTTEISVSAMLVALHVCREDCDEAFG
jgi:hypothetical protein